MSITNKDLLDAAGNRINDMSSTLPTSVNVGLLQAAVEYMLRHLEESATAATVQAPETTELPAGHCGLGCLHEPHMHRWTPDSAAFWCIGKTVDVPLTEAIRPTLIPPPPSPSVPEAATCEHANTVRFGGGWDWCSDCGALGNDQTKSWRWLLPNTPILRKG